RHTNDAAVTQKLAPPDAAGGQFVDEVVLDLAAATPDGVNDLVVLLHGSTPCVRLPVADQPGVDLLMAVTIGVWPAGVNRGRRTATFQASMATQIRSATRSMLPPMILAASASLY